MIIGVIGASLAGLAAARELSLKGHQVTVYEKSNSWSGRLKTTYIGNNKVPVDLSTPFLVSKPETQSLFSELLAKSLVKPVVDSVSHYAEGQFRNSSRNYRDEALLVATKGIESIAEYLSRYSDIRFGGEVAGVTYLGDQTKKKSQWMINLASFEVFEADAVIIALPAVQARQVLENSQDRTPVRRLLNSLDKIEYKSRVTVAASYPGKKIDSFRLLEVVGMDIELITNETLGLGSDELVLTFHSTDDFFVQTEEHPENEVADRLLKQAASILGDFVYHPDKTIIERHKYVSPVNHFDDLYTLVNGLDGKLAIVGDYFKGHSLESSYVSGLKLAQSWA